MREMKDSGIDIVGEIPKSWKLERLRYLCDITTGNQDTQDADSDGEYDFYVRSPKIEKSTKYSFDGEGILMAGDGVGAGRIFHHAYGKYAVHQRVYIINNIREIDSSFLFYYMSNLFPKLMDKGSAQSTVPSIRLPMLLNFTLALPDKKKQNLIADFLDSKCSEIDATAEDIQKEISLLEDYKKSLITEAVTKGLNPDAEMKDSGIGWIGDIPKDWEIIRIKNIGEYRNGLTYKPTDITDENTGILVLRSSNIQAGKISLKDNVYVSTFVRNDLKVQKGDILICSRNGSRELVGKNAIIEDLQDVTFGAFMMIFRCDSPKYLYYILNSMVFSYYLGSFFTSTINQLTGSNFGNMKIVYVSNKLEQNKIVSYLDSKCSEIDAIIADKKRQLDILAEYQKSLIYEYVTGKKEVPVHG